MNSAANKDRFSTLFSSAFLLIGIRVGGMACAMLLMLMLARLLSPSELGSYAMAMSTAMLGGLACTLNYGSGAVRFLAQYAAKQRWGLAYSYINQGRQIIWRNSLVITSVAIAIFFFSEHSHLALALLSVPFIALLRTEAAQVHALGHVVRSGLPGMLLRPVLLLASIAVLAYLKLPLSAETIMAWVFCTAVFIAIFQHVLFEPLLPPRPRDYIEEHNEQSEWAKVGRQLIIPVLFLELSIDTITVLAGLVLPAEELAALSITLRLQSIVLFGVTSINMAAGPRLSQAYHRGDLDEVNKLLQLSGHLKLWPSLIAIAILSVIGGWILGFFGEHYATYNNVLLILCLCPVVLAISGPTVLFMTVLGLQQRGSILFAGSLAALAVLVPFMGSIAGPQGIAASVVVVWLVWNQVLRLWIKRETQIDTAIRFWPSKKVALQTP